MVYRVFLHVSPSNILVGPWVGKAVVVELITGGVEDFCKEPCATGRFGCAGGGAERLGSEESTCCTLELDLGYKVLMPNWNLVDVRYNA